MGGGGVPCAPLQAAQRRGSAHRCKRRRTLTGGSVPCSTRGLRGHQRHQTTAAHRRSVLAAPAAAAGRGAGCRGPAVGVRAPACVAAGARPAQQLVEHGALELLAPVGADAAQTCRRHHVEDGLGAVVVRVVLHSSRRAGLARPLRLVHQQGAASNRVAGRRHAGLDLPLHSRCFACFAVMRPPAAASRRMFRNG